ncbi:protein transport protein bet1 [Cytospora paraplurivora]|uniref:Protein transport protein bet1 n=1 Tax=Cytospora paraplurivora TaxID=2898453 RepID=A0AAN9UET1_9PEZI
MASRFNSTLHQRDSRSALFEGYTGSGADNRRDITPSPSRLNPGGGYGYGYPGAIPSNANGNGSYNSSGDALGVGYRSATPNKRGQYSDAVLNELESQNDAQIEGIMGKVRVLKDMTVAIGDEIRESSALAEKMNDQFDRARLRLRGTMNRMMLMAERTGVGWRVWLAFFAAVILLFTYVWLF